MMRSLTCLAYKGSIPEAIFEAKRQKKLFVVYISGENIESATLEESTWTDATVADALSKYCVLLHIKEGSADATNFSAIYPYNSVPCITAVGFSGAQVWRNEGFVSAEALASSLEKAWLSLHIQETTASILSAALASKKHEPSASGVFGTASPAEGSSSDAAATSSSMNTTVLSSEEEPLVTSAMMEISDTYKHAENALEKKISSRSDSPSKSSSSDNEQLASSADATKTLANVEDKESSSVKVVKESVPPVKKENYLAVGTASTDEGSYHTPDKNADDHSSEGPEREKKLLASEANEEPRRHEIAGVVDGRSSDKMDNFSSLNNSSDVHLNIRLPDGVSLQEKFSVTSTLGMVKDCVDRNQTNGVGSYDLAIPYPRKVFSNQDLSKSLSELGLFNRQALIVVPRQRTTSYPRGGSSSVEQTNSAPYTHSGDGSDGGYFAFVRRIFAYVNPFSYFGGGATPPNSGPESQTGIWQYGPNPALRNNFSQMGRTDSPSSTSRNTSTGGSGIRSRQPTTSRIGSNIHTLKHDEDDARFSGKNAFWNGNSTQYGGDNSGR